MTCWELVDLLTIIRCTFLCPHPHIVGGIKHWRPSSVCALLAGGGKARMFSFCSLSLLLNLICDKAVIREATDNLETGISVCGHIINIRYADDKAVVANSQKRLQLLMDNLNKVTREFGMKIGVIKTKVMWISRKIIDDKLNIYVDGQLLDLDRQKKIRSIWNVNMEKNGKDQLAWYSCW